MTNRLYPQWEYLIRTYTPKDQLSDLAFDLDNVGERGWELVNAFLTPKDTAVLILKRPKGGNDNEQA